MSGKLSTKQLDRSSGIGRLEFVLKSHFENYNCIILAMINPHMLDKSLGVLDVLWCGFVLLISFTFIYYLGISILCELGRK
jgi:hypothetical protein